DAVGRVMRKGSEIETDHGQGLVYGVNDGLLQTAAFGRIDNALGDVLDAARRYGAVAAPAHPGRPNVGLFDHFARRGAAPGVELVEIYNGNSRPGEDERAAAEAARLGYRGIAGSDSHIVSPLGRCGQ